MVSRAARAVYHRRMPVRAKALDPVRPASARWPWVVAGVCFTVLFTIVWWIRGVEPFGMDQGLFACFAQFPHLTPYVDIWDSKPPGILYAWRIAARVFGTRPLGIWTCEFFVLIGAALLARRIAIRVTGATPAAGRIAGIAAAVFVVAGMWAPGWGGYWARAQSEELLALPALGALWFAMHGGRGPSRLVRADAIPLEALEQAPYTVSAAAAAFRTRSAFWCGVLTGVALLFKIPSLAMAGAWCVLWWAESGFGAALRRALWMTLGIALPCAIAAAWLGAQGALGAMVDAVFSYGAIYSAVIGQGLSWGTVVAQFGHDLAVAVPGLVVLGVAGAVWLAITRRALGAALVAWIVLAAGAVISQRQLAGYHFLLLVPPLAVAGGIAVGEALGGLRSLRSLNPPLRAAAIAVLVVLAAGMVFAGVQWWRAYSIDLAFMGGKVSKEAYLHALRSGPFDPAEEEALVQVARRVDAGKPILVWGLSPGAYALADRRPATRYPFHHLFLTDAPLSLRYPDLERRRAEFMDGLKHDPPGAIFVADGDVNGFEPKDSRTQMLEFPEFRNFVFDGYRDDGRVGHWTVFVRK